MERRQHMATKEQEPKRVGSLTAMSTLLAPPYLRYTNLTVVLVTENSVCFKFVIMYQ